MATGNMLTDLVSSVRGGKAGTGMAQKAVNSISLNKEYKQYVTDSMSTGEEPMSYEEYKRSKERTWNQ